MVGSCKISNDQNVYCSVVSFQKRDCPQMTSFSGPVVYLKPQKSELVYSGVYSGAIARISHTPTQGSVVEVVGHEKQIVGYGFWDQDALMRVCMFGLRKWPKSWPDDHLPSGFWRGRISRALQRRQMFGFPNANSNAYRLVNSFGDFLPNVIIDQFDQTSVIQLKSLTLLPHKNALVNAVREVLSPETILMEHPDGSIEESFGIAMPVIEALSGGQRIAFEPLTVHRPQRLDIMDHLQRFGKLCKNKKVLDAYSHEGIFSVSAAFSKSAHLISLSTTAEDLAQTRRNATLNNVFRRVDLRRGIPPDAMDSWHKSGRRFDRICLDPMDLRIQNSARPPLEFYTSLVTKAVRILNFGGLLAVFSRHQGISMKDHRAILANVSVQLKRPILFVEAYTSRSDFPTPTTMSELNVACGVLAEVG